MPGGGFTTLGQIIGEDSLLLYKDPTWNTVLHTAAAQGQVDLVGTLVSGGFPVDLQNASGQSALHLATLSRRLKVCKYLLEAGADFMLEDDGQTTALDIAIGLDDFGLVDLFLSTKPSFQCPSRYLADALHLGQEQVIRAFAHNGYTLRMRDPSYHGTLLHFMAVISDGIDVLIFQRLLDEGVDVNAQDGMGATALHVVAQKSSNPDILRLLLNAGADPNAVDKSKFRGTPLFAATLGGRVLNVEILINRGANPFWKLSPGRTMLHIAAQDGIPDLVELFIKQGLDVNGLDEDGHTAAYWAALNDHIDAIKVMLNHGLDLRNEQGVTMKLALQKGNMKLVQLLLNHGVSLPFGKYVSFASMSEKGRNMPLLLLFCRNANMAETQWTIGADQEEEAPVHAAKGKLNSRERTANSKGSTPRSAEVHIEFDMEEDGAEEEVINSTEGGIHSPPRDPPPRSSNFLWHLMTLRQFETVAAAIECGADVSSLPKTALSVLCLVCAEYNLIRGMKALVAAGAPSTNTSKPFGWTAAHIAAWKGHLEIVRIVRAGGWNMRATDRDNSSAMHLAASQGHIHIVEELLGEVDVHHANADGNTALHFAAGTARVGIVSRLMEAGVNVNKANAGGMIPLLWACQYNRLDAAKALVEAGSSLTKGDFTGASPLHYAARYGAKEVLQYLLSLDVDLDIRKADGSTSLHLAAESGALSSFQPLLDAGADPNLVNNHGKSPLEVAVSKKNFEIVEFLMSRSRVRWQAPRSTHIFFCAFQSRDERIAASVLSNMELQLGQKEARSVIRKMYPELVAELLTDPESTVSVCSLLVDYLPKDDDVRYMIAYHLLMSCIKHSDNTELVQSLLKVHPGMAQQVAPGGWRPLHSACKYGRSGIAKILLQHGAKVDDQVLASKQTPLGLARRYSPDSGVVELIERCVAVRKAIKQHRQSRETGLKPKGEQG